MLRAYQTHQDEKRWLTNVKEAPLNKAWNWTPEALTVVIPTVAHEAAAQYIHNARRYGICMRKVVHQERGNHLSFCLVHKAI